MVQDLLPQAICSETFSLLSWYDLPSPSPPTSGHLQPHLPPLHSNSEAYLHNLCNYIAPTLRLTVDQYRTLSQTVPGCVTRHTRHASVTHFRPISGNIVEVTLVTSPNLYINSHAKGTGFPLVRITIMIPP